MQLFFPLWNLARAYVCPVGTPLLICMSFLLSHWAVLVALVTEDWRLRGKALGCQHEVMEFVEFQGDSTTVIGQTGV